MKRLDEIAPARRAFRPTRRVRLLPLLAALAFLFTSAVVVPAQNTMEERCRNNQQRVAELQKQAAKFEKELTYTEV
jgi:hypothetical protein